MEQKNKNYASFVFEDYLPVIIMTAFFMLAYSAPLAFGTQPSLSFAVLATAAACLYSVAFLGFEHFDSLFDAVFETVKTFAMVIGFFYLFDGVLLPTGFTTGMLTVMKSVGIALMPWVVIFFWSFSSILAGRRKRSKKMLAEAYESAEETLRRTREVSEECRAALERSDKILNHGKTGSANPA